MDWVKIWKSCCRIYSRPSSLQELLSELTTRVNDGLVKMIKSEELLLTHNAYSMSYSYLTCSPAYSCPAILMLVNSQSGISCIGRAGATHYSLKASPPGPLNLKNWFSLAESTYRDSMSEPLTFATCELTQNQSIHRVHKGVVLFPVLCGMLSPPAARHHPVQCALYSSQLLPLTRAHCTVHCQGKGHSLHSWLKWTSLACTVLWEDSLHGTDVQQWRLEWFKLIQGWQRWFLLPTSVWKCIVILPFSKAALPAFTETTSPSK